MGYIPDDIDSSNRIECDGVTKISLSLTFSNWKGSGIHYKCFLIECFFGTVDHQNMVEITRQTNAKINLL